jgi:hypothetical protein
MAEPENEQKRPCLHCMLVELIDDFIAAYPTTAGSDKVDTEEADEVIDAITKTVAELTSQQDGAIRRPGHPGRLQCTVPPRHDVARLNA